MAPKVEPVESDTELPARTGVVVIGGGIVGVSAALALARKEVPVVLCEKGEIAGEQSSRNWGWCRKTGRDTREMALIKESMRLWESMDATVEADTGFRRCGVLFATDDEARIARFEGWLEHARRYQFDSRIVTGNELADLLPGAARRFKAAMFTPSDGRAEPAKAAPAIARAARRHGATILTRCAVRGVETSGGRVSGVVTERGRIACDTVLVAGGAWSRQLCRQLGVRLPQLKVRATVQRTEPVENGLEHSLWTPAFALRKREDGGYTIATSGQNVVDLVPDSVRFARLFWQALRMEAKGLRLRLNSRFLREWRMARYADLNSPSPYEAERVLDPEPVPAIARKTKAALDAAFPAFRSVGIAESWAGMIDVTPDAVPVISPVEAVPGLVLATGFSGHGFGIGPGAGRLAADLAAGDAPIVDPEPFRFSRFADGTPVRLEAWL